VSRNRPSPVTATTSAAPAPGLMPIGTRLQLLPACGWVPDMKWLATCSQQKQSYLNLSAGGKHENQHLRDCKTNSKRSLPSPQKTGDRMLPFQSWDVPRAISKGVLAGMKDARTFLTGTDIWITWRKNPAQNSTICNSSGAGSKNDTTKYPPRLRQAMLDYATQDSYLQSHLLYLTIPHCNSC